EAEQVNAPAAIENFHCGGLPLNAFGVKQEPARQRIAIPGICGENRPLKPALRLEGGPALEHHDRVARHTPKRRMIQISKLYFKQRTRAKELIVLETVQDIGHRQAERLDGHQRSVVECNQGPPAMRELA